MNASARTALMAIEDVLIFLVALRRVNDSQVLAWRPEPAAISICHDYNSSSEGIEVPFCVGTEDVELLVRAVVVVCCRCGISRTAQRAPYAALLLLCSLRDASCLGLDLDVVVFARAARLRLEAVARTGIEKGERPQPPPRVCVF